MSCGSQAKEAKHHRRDSKNGPLSNAHVFDTIANAFDDARKEISDGLHGGNRLGRIRPKIPYGTGGAEKTSVGTVGRGLSRGLESAEPRAKKAAKPQASSIKNADFAQ